MRFAACSENIRLCPPLRLLQERSSERIRGGERGRVVLDCPRQRQDLVVFLLGEFGGVRLRPAVDDRDSLVLPLPKKEEAVEGLILTIASLMAAGKTPNPTTQTAFRLMDAVGIKLEAELPSGERVPLASQNCLWPSNRTLAQPSRDSLRA